MVRVRAPELPQYTWLNTDKPLSIKKLRGRIVILDFWTYCCINCLHVLPDLKYLEQKYKDSLTVIGVHSAKFDNEKDIENIRQAILRYDIEHPVLVDKNFRVWQEYAVRAYPSFMVIDPEGYVVASFMGEGKRDILEELIQQIIKQHQDKGTINLQELNVILEKQRQPIITPLAFPGKVLATSSGLFIADTGHNRIVVTTLEGEVLDIIGRGKSGFKDGNFSIAEFSVPQGMTFDNQNQILYVADTENHALRKVDLRRQSVNTIAGTGTQSRNLRPTQGNALNIDLNSPWDLVKHENLLYIVMAGSHQIWVMNLENNIIKTYAGTGAEACFDGELDTSVFAQPSGITINSNFIYTADSESSSIRAIELDSGKVRTICGSGDLYLFGDKDGIGEEVRLQHCMGVEYAQGNLWVADTYNHKIKLVNPITGECKTVLDSGASNTKFSEPSGLSILSSNLYIADTNNHTIQHVNLNTFEVITLKIPGLCAPDFCIPNNI
ncbi:MAG: redoxin domain-containing protein [Calothrix sp. FI2-JRJ7]|jgi:thiol-disulfide isomerase/thioredoxin|nr:redoxin domain-containing protein [Calothrix sp. FI2-JRJ7]